MLLTFSVVGLVCIDLIPSMVIATPFIVIFGTTTLLSSITLAVVVFQYLGLSNKAEALGLPEGSVRALIALSLIVIFAIMVVFMQGELAISPLKYENGTYITDVNGTIQYEPVASEAQVDFSKQVLTTVSTLVVAVAGFYFGTRSVLAAKAEKERPMLLINPSGSKEWKLGDPPLIIAIETFPEDEKVSFKIDDPLKGSITLEEDQFKLTPTNCKAGDKINLTFALAKNPEVQQTIEVTVMPAE